MHDKFIGPHKEGLKQALAASSAAPDKSIWVSGCWDGTDRRTDIRPIH